MSILNGKAICIFGDYNLDSYRYTTLRRGMKFYGVRVLDCNCYLRFNNFMVRRKVSRAIWYIIKGYLNLIKKFWPIRNEFDYFFLPGDHLNVPLSWFLSKLFNKKVILDIYDPLYQFAKMNNYSKWQLRIRYYIEKINLKMADHLLVYTDEIRKLVQQDYNIASDKFTVFPVAADTEIFHPKNNHVDKDGSVFKVIFWGGLQGHHGIEIIIKAVKLLKKREDIHFYFAGVSRPYKSKQELMLKDLVEDEHCNNVFLTGYLPLEQLIELIQQADLCLGIFSDKPCALATVPCKVFEALAIKKPIITERSPAAEAWFTHKEHLYLVPPENPKELARAILELKNNRQLREKLAEKGYAKFNRDFNEIAICKEFNDILYR